jgi:pimeloyl-ACP methyl ester carboxylesterase
MISRRSVNSLLIGGGVLLLAGGGCAVATDRRASAREEGFEASHPPVGRMLDVGGLQLHLVQEGAGPDLVLIHGASGNLRDFTYDLVGRLSGRFRVTAFDRPGHGFSQPAGQPGDSPEGQAAILRAAAAQIGIQNPVLVGHSYGGAVAMAWALADPAGVAAVVSLAGATHPWPGGGLGALTPLLAGPVGGTLAALVTAYAPMGRADGVIARVFRPDPVPAGYADHVGAGLAIRRETLVINARQLNALHGHLTEMAPRYPVLPIPVEILHGDADRTVGLEFHGRRLAEDVPGARLTVLRGVGHMPHHADTRATVAVINRAHARASEGR